MRVILAFAISLCSFVHAEEPTEPEPTDAELLDYFAADYFENLGYGEKIRILGNEIEVQRVREVGDEKTPEIPYPTNCSYVEHGLLSELYVRTPEQRAQDFDLGTHEISYVIDQVELTDQLAGTTANPHCQEFAKRENSRKHYYSFEFEVLNENQIRLHTAGGGDYIQGGIRTMSTLDEVFTRESYLPIDEEN